MRRAYVFVAVPIAAMLIACGASTSGKSDAGGEKQKPAAQEAKEPTVVQIGQPLTLTEKILTTKNEAQITVSGLKANAKSGNQFDKPSKGQFVVVDVAVAVTEGKVSLTAFNFKLISADGTVYDPTVTLAAKPDLAANDLTPGQKSSGKIAFDAAAGAEKGAKIGLKNLLSQSDAGYWQLP